MSVTDLDILPGEDRAGRRIIRPTIHHFGIATTRHEEMLAWYRDVLGLEIVAPLPAIEPLPRMTFVTSDEHHHRGGFITTSQLKDNPDRLDYSRVQHLAWEYEDIDQLLESWERIHELGIEPVACWCHNGSSFAFYYKDPDRNTVELTAPAHESLRAGLARVLSAEWATNPNGQAVDPRKLIEARSRGVGLDELRERAIANEYKPDVPPHPLAVW